jgi:hypothetical protein
MVACCVLLQLVCLLALARIDSHDAEGLQCILPALLSTDELEPAVKESFKSVVIDAPAVCWTPF